MRVLQRRKDGMIEWGSLVDSLREDEPASAAEVADEICAPGAGKVCGDGRNVVSEQWVF